MFDFLDDGFKRVEYLLARPIKPMFWWESSIGHPTSSERKIKIYYVQLEKVLKLLDLFLLGQFNIPVV